MVRKFSAITKKQKHESEMAARREESAKAKEPIAVKMMAHLERERKMLTHLPMQSRCEYCVLGRGIEAPHSQFGIERKDEHIPLLSADFWILRRRKMSLGRPSQRRARIS